MSESERVSLMFQTNKAGHVLPLARNVYMALRNHDAWLGVLRHNALTETDEYHGSETHDPLGKVVERPKVIEITDDEVFHTRLWLESAVVWSRPPSKELVFDAMEAVARKAAYHPVRDYLAPLAAQWDGTARIAHWLADFCGVEDSPYTRAVAAKTLIGAAARAFNPGCKLDTMLVLVGRQGVRKSTLIRTLGRSWTADTPLDIGSKDAFEALRGAWLVEIPELAGMGGKDVERLKAFFSSPIDTYRPPYARKPVRRPRTCAFIGSTNDADFLKDSTGSRRFWCVKVGEIDVEAVEAVVDQLWAEAALRALEGSPHWLDEPEAIAAEEMAEEFLSLDPWEGPIRRFIEGNGRDYVWTHEIYDLLDIPTKDRHAGSAQRIVRIMCGRLKWKRPAGPVERERKKARGFLAP